MNTSNTTTSDFSSRVRFETNVERMLQHRPRRYQDIIYAQIERHNKILRPLDMTLEGEIGLHIVASYMVKLDNEYINTREDNE